MKYIKSTLALCACLALIVAACDTSGVSSDSADQDIAHKQEKTLLCHVGNETGPEGQPWPYTWEVDGVQYQADAGKIDLIEVANPAKHLGNESHTWNGQSDYLPSDEGASGSGTEDTDGDGVDDGCEIPVDACPCWDEDELQSITAENHLGIYSCSAESQLPSLAVIQNIEGSTPDVEGGFAALVENEGPFCATRDYPPFGLAITPEQVAICIQQIVDRCAAIGDPISPAAPDVAGKNQRLDLSNLWSR